MIKLLFLCFSTIGVLNLYATKNKEDYIIRTATKLNISLSSYFEKNLQNQNNDANKNCVQITNFQVNTKNNISLPAKLYEQNNDYLIILGLGKGAGAKETEGFVNGLINSYDVLVFDYEWHHYSLLQWSKAPFNMQKYFFEHNHEEVISTVKFIRELNKKRPNKYKSIIGLGECYSAFVFSKAQSISTQRGGVLFDKLILDSPFYSIKSCIKAISDDPWLMCNPLEGGCPSWLGLWLLFAPVSEFGQLIATNISISDHLQYIGEIPILFIRGQNDTFVQQKYFEAIWESVKTKQKAVFFTPFNHSNSFKKRNARAQYLDVIDKFIKNEYHAFIENFQKFLR